MSENGGIVTLLPANQGNLQTMKHTVKTTSAMSFLAILAKGWGVKDGGTAAKLTLKALGNPPCGTARFSKRAMKAEARCKRAFARLSKLAGERAAYALVYEAQREAWMASF